MNALRRGDSETGLLRRWLRFSASPVGRTVTRVDYADYREAGRSTFKIDSVQANVTIEAARFARPAPPGSRR